MKKYFSLTILVFSLSFIFPTFSFAQGMPVLSKVEGMGNNVMNGSNAITQSDEGHTAREEAEGKAIWEKLSAKGGSASGGQADQITCADLSDEDFGALGEYFMGQMAGEQHEAMNNMMIQMVGEESEEQMHIAMGKRMSNCEPNAPMPQNMMDSGMMPMMMNMLAPYGTEGSRSGMMGGDNFMMGSWNQNPMWWGGVGSWFLSFLWLVWLIVGILATIWLWRQITKK